MNTTWLNLGSSHTAPAGFMRALQQYPEPTVITTNSGIKLCVPDYYFLSDQTACKQFARRANDLRRTHGLQLITLKRVPSAWKDRGIPEPDHAMEVTGPGGNVEFSRDGYTDCMFSGLFCAQFAIANGCTRMLLPGHEGYVSNMPQTDNGGDYWEGGAVRNKRAFQHTTLYIGPFWRSCVAACPDIEFVFYGRLNFEIDGDNVKKVSLNETANTASMAAAAGG